jgi:hypothetical protein
MPLSELFPRGTPVTVQFKDTGNSYVGYYWGLSGWRLSHIVTAKRCVASKPAGGRWRLRPENAEIIRREEPKAKKRNMNSWERYLLNNVESSGRHRKFTRWRVDGLWEFVRDDGARTHHKVDTPCPFWESAVEWSMEFQDTGRDPYGGD